MIFSYHRGHTKNMHKAVRLYKGIKTNQGFTLIEVLVAVAIISIGFFGVYTLHIQTIAASNTVRFHLKAPMLAQMKISEFDSTLGELSDSSGTFDENYAGFSWKVIPGEIESESLGSVSEKLVNYELEVFNESSSYSVTVYRFPIPSDN